MARNEQRYRATEARYLSAEGVHATERWVEMPEGNRVRLLESGSGRPLLFVHGGSSSGANFAPLLARLSGLNCLSLDRPGCGLSDDVPRMERLRSLDAVHTYADDMLMHVLDGLELDQADVVCTSAGGLFTLRAAAAHPDRFRRIVVVAWTVGAPMASVPMSMRVAMMPGLGPLMTKIPPTRFAIKMILRQIGLGRALNSGKVSEAMIDWFLSLLRDTDTLANESRMSPDLITPLKGANTKVQFTDELLGRITASMLFLWGDEDPMGGAETARAFSSRFADATLEMISESGHAPWIDEPDLVASRIADFVQAP